MQELTSSEGRPMWTRIVLGIFLVFTIAGAAGAMSETLVEAGDWLFTAALFVTYAWESRRGRFAYRPPWTVLLLMAVALVLINAGVFDRYLQNRWLVPGIVTGVALYELAKHLRARSRDPSSHPAGMK